MKLSVIVPCFNAADTIPIQLEALANQQWSEPWEVIVSDNGSTDESVAIVEQYKDKLPNLRIVDSSEQRGAAHARNVGVLAATSDALAFCDADDEVAPGWVAAMGEALSKYDFVACRREYKKLNEPWTLKYRVRTQLTQIDGLQEYKPAYLPHASGSTLGVKRSIHEAVGGYDETMLRLQDTDYCWKIQLAGTKLHFLPEAVVHYRFRHTMTDIYNQARLWEEYKVLLYKKYRPLGMPKVSWKAGVKAWLLLLKNFPQIFSEKDRVIWLRMLASCVGRLYGSFKYRVLVL